MLPRDRLVFPLDVPDLETAQEWIDRLSGEVGVLKVGLELFTAAGPDAVRAVHASGSKCFLDLKLHDISATMASAVRAAVKLGVDYLTVHAAAAPAGLAAVRDAAADSNTRLLAVTVLTSLDAGELDAIGLEGPPAAAVERLARLAMRHGIDGLVCSPEECASLRRSLADDVLLVVPGIRPAGSDRGDQTRVATPGRARRDGADLLVVGRPIRNAEDPVAAARAIVAEIAEASA